MRTIKPHPILAAQFVAAYLSLLIIPALRGIFVFIENGTITNLILGQIIGFLLILTLGIIKFCRTKIIVNKDFITFKSGIFMHKSFTLKPNEIECLRTKINPLKRFLHSANVKFYTNAAKIRADFDITISLKNLRTIKSALNFNSEHGQGISKKSRALSTAIYALSASSITIGAVTLWPIISLASEVFERNFSQEIYTGIDEATRPLSPIFPGIMAVLLAIFAIVLLFSFTAILFKHSHFKTQIGGDFIKIQSGFLTLFKTYVRRNCIAAAQISQTPMLSALSRENITIFAPISVSNPLNSQVILPASKNQTAIDNFAQNFKIHDDYHTQIGMTKRGTTRFRRFALLIIAYIIGGAIVLRLIPHDLCLELAIIAFSAIFIAIIWYAVRFNAAKFCEINIGKNQIKSTMLYGFTVKKIHAKSNRISIIKFTQNPFDKRLDVESAKIFIANPKVIKCRMVNISNQDSTALIDNFRDL